LFTYSAATATAAVAIVVYLKAIHFYVRMRAWLFLSTLSHFLVHACIGTAGNLSSSSSRAKVFDLSNKWDYVYVHILSLTAITTS
jgi:hypothetical protein